MSSLSRQSANEMAGNYIGRNTLSELDELHEEVCELNGENDIDEVKSGLMQMEGDGELFFPIYTKILVWCTFNEQMHAEDAMFFFFGGLFQFEFYITIMIL